MSTTETMTTTALESSILLLPVKDKPAVSISEEDAPQILSRSIENVFLLLSSKVHWDGWRERVYTVLEEYTAARMGIDITSLANLEDWVERKSFNSPIYGHNGKRIQEESRISEDPQLVKLALITMFIAETPSLAEAKWWYDSYEDLANFVDQIKNKTAGEGNPISKWISGSMESGSKMTFQEYAFKINEKQNSFKSFFTRNDIVPNCLQAISAAFSILQLYALKLSGERQKVFKLAKLIS